MKQEHWSVELPEEHPGYKQIQLKRGLPGNDRYTVVEVDAERFMQCYAREMRGYVIPPVPQWAAEKIEGIREFLDPAGGVPDMARISFRVVTRTRLFGLLSPVDEGVVSFTNGRHRCTYMHHAGATRFPVEVAVEYADLLRQHCGAKSHQEYKTAGGNAAFAWLRVRRAGAHC